jgi:hypothetical protein
MLTTHPLVKLVTFVLGKISTKFSKRDINSVAGQVDQATIPYVSSISFVRYL